MNEDESHYESYLLRIWRVKAGEGVQWRITLENTLSGKQQSFPNLKAFFQYLQDLNDLTSGEGT